jgi:NAD(P)H dehydrogenase (quinone)
MIVVTGATGKLGQLVVAALLKRVSADKVVAAVRNPTKAAGLAAKGVQIRQADYSNPDSLSTAFVGAEKVLLISSNEVGQRLKQHRAVVEAAKAAKVKLIAYTSVLRANSSGLGLAAEHKSTENAIAASGIPYAFLRNGWYIENYTENLGPALAQASLVGCAGKGRIAAASRADLAAATAVVLTQEQSQNSVYELGGDQRFTMTDLAQTVSDWAGRPIGYRDLSYADYKQLLLSVGVPPDFAELLADSDVGISRGELDCESGDLHRLLGRATQTVIDVLAGLPR